MKAYLEKSHNALKSMEVNAREGIAEWTVSASYYAKYFAVYALLTKIGVKCEIHDCTIALFGHLFNAPEFHHLVTELRRSKDDRVDVQYYSRQVKADLDGLMRQTKEFVLQIEELIDGLNTQKTADLQKSVRLLASGKS